MDKTLINFKKKKKFLLCIDSDGCAMDTMTIKHVKCFGPCFADEWNLTQNREDVLKRWNDINLYQKTRGINRFKGLAQILFELYPDDKNVAEFKNWTDSAKELSENAVSAVYDKTGNEVFKKALSWSKAVNVSINALSDNEKIAFSGVKQAIEYAHQLCDIAIVSSANYASVVEEWNRCGLLEYVDVVTTQSDGSKAYCIEQLVKKGYDRKNVLKCGDAIGDLDAAKKNGVYFYPILAGKEVESWADFARCLDAFVNETFSLYAGELLDKFYENFNNN